MANVTSQTFNNNKLNVFRHLSPTRYPDYLLPSWLIYNNTTTWIPQPSPPGTTYRQPNFSSRIIWPTTSVLFLQICSPQPIARIQAVIYPQWYPSSIRYARWGGWGGRGNAKAESTFGNQRNILESTQSGGEQARYGQKLSCSSCVDNWLFRTMKCSCCIHASRSRKSSWEWFARPLHAIILFDVKRFRKSNVILFLLNGNAHSLGTPNGKANAGDGRLLH